MRTRNSKLLLIASLTFQFSSHHAVATQLSAREIIERAKVAMDSTMKYQVGAAGDAATTVVYQKCMTNGTTASRTEISSGAVKLTYLFSTQGAYQVFPRAHVAIDMKFQMGQVPSANPFAMVSLATAESKGSATYDKKNCYKIQALLAPVATNLSAMLKENKTPVPHACQYLIETNTYHVLQMTLMHGESALAKVEYKHFEGLPEVPEDFFDCPKDYKIEKPDSMEQYSRMVTHYLAGSPKHIPKGFAQDPKTGYIVKVDPQSGAFIALTNSVIPSSYQSYASSNQKTIRIIVRCALCLMTLGFLYAVLFCRRYLT